MARSKANAPSRYSRNLALRPAYEPPKICLFVFLAYILKIYIICSDLWAPPVRVLYRFGGTFKSSSKGYISIHIWPKQV